ncbi:MAG: flagellar hook protein FlgE [Candidatus Hydrogenedentes bacterium]|nr:flagellar hook protein FlgE [Candidatus Hydrogenedentota bacterium]
MGSAMYTGVTGLLAHQRRMDVVANNIANVNTTGFRSARVQFQDLFSQTLQGGSGPVGNFGGTNPLQVGLGVGIGSIDTDFGQGPLFSTGVSSDLAIQGSGFFVVGLGSENFYTRDGTFSLNSLGQLTDPATGMHVRGYMADPNGVVPLDTPLTDLSVPVGSAAIVRATESASLAGNLDASFTTGATIERTIRVYDSLGTPRDIQLTFTQHDQVDDGGTMYNAWLWSASYDGADVTNVPVGDSGVLLFNTDGAFHAEGALNTGTGTFTSRAALPSQNQISVASVGVGGAQPVLPFEFALNFNYVTDLDQASDITVTSQDGFPRGTLQSFSIGGNGIISGTFSNGLTQVLGQIALASFSNVGGLARRGDNMFAETTASGVPQVGRPQTGGRGSVSGGVLEGSNVDLGSQFSNMIVTQRGFQANARIISAADVMLQEAVNLVR